MSKIVAEKTVRRAIIKYLARKGWDRGRQEKETTEHGVDITVRHNKYPRYFFIEVKGSSSGKSARSVNEVAFVYSLGQIITRMKNTGAYYGIGLPELSAKIALRRIPWQIAKKLSLFVFSVDHNEKVKQYSWKDIKKSKR